mgnify:CR=1 FL=1
MDVKAIRLRNLRALVEEVGGIRALAELADTSYQTLWQIVGGTELPSGKVRALGYLLARKIETAVNKPQGWLDVDHGERAALDDEAIRFALWWQGLDEKEREKFHQVRTLITEKAIPDSVVEQKMPIVLAPKDGKKRGPGSQEIGMRAPRTTAPVIHLSLWRSRNRE